MHISITVCLFVVILFVELKLLIATGTITWCLCTRVITFSASRFPLSSKLHRFHMMHTWFCGGWLAKVVTILMAAGSSAKTRNADCLAPLDVACRGLLLHPPETFEGPFDETADEPPNLAGFPPLG